MPRATKPIPEGFHAVTAYLRIRGAAKAIDFYRQAFGATERYRMEMPDGRLGHAEILIGDSIVMLADEFPDHHVHGPQSLGGTSVGLVLYVEDCDLVFQRAVTAGAKALRPLANQFYGDRSGTVADPFGHEWTIATHKEDLSQDEMNQRAAAAFAQMPQS